MRFWRRLAAELRRDDLPCELEYVGFWSRALAGIIDVGLLCALLFPLVQLAQRGPGAFLTGESSLLPLLLAAAAALLFWLAQGSTPGKLAISAIVVDERTCCPPSLPQQLGRSLGLLLSLVPFGLGFLWVAFQPKKQGWHDKLAGTLVVRARRRPADGLREQAPSHQPAPALAKHEAAPAARR